MLAIGILAGGGTALADDGSDYTAIHQENVSVTFTELW
jgi:hypothetical protein